MMPQNRNDNLYNPLQAHKAILSHCLRVEAATRTQYQHFTKINLLTTWNDLLCVGCFYSHFQTGKLRFTKESSLPERGSTVKNDYARAVTGVFTTHTLSASLNLLLREPRASPWCNTQADSVYQPHPTEGPGFTSEPTARCSGCS